MRLILLLYISLLKITMIKSHRLCYVCTVAISLYVVNNPELVLVDNSSTHIHDQSLHTENQVRFVGI